MARRACSQAYEPRALFPQRTRCCDAAHFWCVPTDDEIPIIVSAPTGSKRSPKRGSRWRNRRKGYRHQLILKLIDRGFSFRRATESVDAFFDALMALLTRHKKIELPFGTLAVVPNRLFGRSVRFNKIITCPHERTVKLIPPPPPPKAPRTYRYIGVRCPRRECRAFHPVFHVTVRKQHRYLIPSRLFPVGLRCPCGYPFILHENTPFESMSSPCDLDLRATPFDARPYYNPWQSFSHPGRP